MASVQLQWMDDCSVSTEELRSAARKLPKLIIQSKSTSQEDEDEFNPQLEAFDNCGNGDYDELEHKENGSLDNKSPEKFQTAGETLSADLNHHTTESYSLKKDDMEIVNEKHKHWCVNQSVMQCHSNLHHDPKKISEVDMQVISNEKCKLEEHRSSVFKSETMNSADSQKQFNDGVEVTPVFIVNEKILSDKPEIAELVSQQPDHNPQFGFKVINDGIKLPPIRKSSAKPVTPYHYRSHAVRSVNLSTAFGNAGLPSNLRVSTIQKRTSDHRSSMNRVLYPEKPHQLKSNTLELNFLQLSPNSGCAMSYSSAMSRNQAAEKDDQYIRENQMTGKKLFVPFRHKARTVTSRESGLVRKHFPTAEHPFPSRLPLTLDHLPQEVEMFQDNSDGIKDDGLRRKRLQKKATILEFQEDTKKLDDSYLVKFDVDDKMKNLVHRLRGGVVNTLDNLTDEIRDEYEDFITQIDQITYYQLRQAETILSRYTPRTVVVISSSVPKSEVLVTACRPGVLSMIYDVSIETYSTLIEKVRSLLDSYMKGAKMRNLALVSKGGPGYMFLLRKNPITPPKLYKERELLRFWKDLGRLMSKISAEPSTIHLMESNVAGNMQGEMLLKDLEAAMFAHKVKVESPLEVCIKGKEMIRTYFIPEKFKEWKQNRYNT